MRSLLYVSILTTALTLPHSAALAQCSNEWLPGDGLPGVDGEVYAMTTWDPDGAGPLPELLIVGGRFSIAGTIFANNIAAWDGVSWRPLASGVNRDVKALAVHNGKLIVGGLFTSAGGVEARSIASWDGLAWQPLGEGFELWVYALSHYGDQLVAGGGFGVAAWDGATWARLHSESGDQPLEVHGLTEYRGELVAGADFPVGADQPSGIAGWNGTSWRPFGRGIVGIRGLCVYHGELIAGGYYEWGGDLGNRFVAQWNGSSWRALGLERGPLCFVYAFAVYHDELIAAGYDNGSQPPITRWNGTAWTSPDYRIVSGTMYAFASYRGELIAHAKWANRCDFFDGFLRWNGASWRLLAGTEDEIIAFAKVNGELFACGCFLKDGGEITDRLARWDGSSWALLNSGLTGYVSDICEHDGQLIVLGEFSFPGETATHHVARWDGQVWLAMDAGIQKYHEPRKLLVCSGQLFAFTQFGPPEPVIHWDGSEWASLGTLVASVNAMACYNGDLVAAAVFENSSNRVQRWDDHDWQQIGDDLPNQVVTLTGYREQLFAGTSGGNAVHSHVFSFDGAAWTSAGDAANGSVYGLAAFGPNLIAVGDFTAIAGAPAHAVATWNGVAWQALGEGLGATYVAYARSVQVFQGELFVAGLFTSAGNYVSYNWAHWGPPQPIITDQPFSQRATFGDAASFSVSIANVAFTSYQWRKDSVPLLNHGRMSGATTPTLIISHVQPHDEGTYDVLVTNPCGSVTSLPATLTAIPPGHGRRN